MLKKLMYVLICLQFAFTGKVAFAELQDPTIPPLAKSNGSTQINASLFVVSEIIISNDRKLAVI
ncbi:MAG TPA: hypothetical protein VHM20_06710, partial [Gammaproteobacteria bacterium]|nr:hypothetical protein [Gammaproteobacteria bacterium]